MWDFAVIIGPVFGAALSDPVRQYPNSWLASTKFLQKFPFFLPCGVIGALALIMAIVVALFFEEVSVWVNKWIRDIGVVDAYRNTFRFSLWMFIVRGRR
jgi:hypothetical protein